MFSAATISPRMHRPLALLVLALLAAPHTLAHNPPGPVLTCQLQGTDPYHDDLPPNTGNLVFDGDGNLDNRPKKMDITIGPFFTQEACNNPDLGPILAELDPPASSEQKIGNQFMLRIRR